MSNNYCYCWSIETLSGITLRYTTTNTEITFLGETWKPAFSVNNTVIQKNVGLGVDNLELSGAFSEEISKARVESRVFEGAEVEGYRVNLSDTSVYRKTFRGNLGEFSYDEHKYNVEVRSKTYLLSKPRSDIFTRTCPFTFGSSGCGFDTSGVTVSTDISSISGLSITVSDNMLDVYSSGKVLYPDGSFQFVRSQEGSTLYLWEASYGSVGDTIQVTRGCNKTRQACKDFGNIENFGGFDLIPPEDILTTFGTPGKAVFDGGSYYERLT